MERMERGELGRERGCFSEGGTEGRRDGARLDTARVGVGGALGAAVLAFEFNTGDLLGSAIAGLGLHSNAPERSRERNKGSGATNGFTERSSFEDAYAHEHGLQCVIWAGGNSKAVSCKCWGNLAKEC
jgi:hypothetical protein